MPNTIALGFFALAVAAEPSTRDGFVYRLESPPGGASVWVAGGDARIEYDTKDEIPARVEIWKDGGKQILVINERDRTYYDSVAYRKEAGRSDPSVDVMTVRPPFEIAGAEKIRVEVRPQPPPAASDACRPVTVEFSYDLRLRLKVAPGTFPGRVEGLTELCLAESFPVAALPFGHGSLTTSGIEAVDRVFAERFAALRGVPVRRKVSATRRIENGETVSKTSTLELKDARPADIPGRYFEVPPGYRFQEPVIVAPTRQE
jgi:hypothetical protein